MGFSVFGTLTEPRMRHPRGNLVGDPVISYMDSVQDTYGMTNLKIKQIPYQQAPYLLEQTLK